MKHRFTMEHIFGLLWTLKSGGFILWPPGAEKWGGGACPLLPPSLNFIVVRHWKANFLHKALFRLNYRIWSCYYIIHNILHIAIIEACMEDSYFSHSAYNSFPLIGIIINECFFIPKWVQFLNHILSDV